VVNDALSRLQQALPDQDQASKALKKSDTSVTRKIPLTREEFDEHLLAIGLLSRLPDTAADFDDPDDAPVKIMGEPISEMIIRERR
jgi:non-ribosomal peptide synthetase component F